MLKLPLAEGFSIDLEKLENSYNPGSLDSWQPNNPTGQNTGPVPAVYDLVISRGAFLLLDEAFEFCPADYDSISLFKIQSNVCI